MNMIRRLTILCLLVGSVATLSCQEIPATMMRISARLIQPQSEAGMFAAQPKTFWRAGTKYARIAEAPDEQNHIHGLIIINEPDAWMINLSEKSGKHILDSGPSLVVRLPLFGKHTGAKTALNDLEFGTELEFFVKYDSVHSRGPMIDGNATEAYSVTIADARVLLLTDAKSKKPIRVSLSEGKEPRTYEYLSYENNLPFNANLFKPPLGIQIED